MVRVLCCCLIMTAPSACYWACSETVETTASAALEVQPTEAWVLVQTGGAMSYYVPAQIGCGATTGESRYGFSWLAAWHRDGQWLSKDNQGRVISVRPVEIRWVKAAPCGQPGPTCLACLTCP